MTTPAPCPDAFRDTVTMLRRDALHALRNPMMTVSSSITPMTMLLLFVGVLGGAMSKAVGSGSAAVPYINYITPGIILMAVGSGVSATAINLCLDNGEGIIARFRTMATARTSVLTGQVIGSAVRTRVAILLVLALALLLGVRTAAGPARWLLALGVVAMLALALTWLGVAIGLFTTSPAGANSRSLIPQFLPFVSSGFVPTSSMPVGVPVVRREPALHPDHRDAAGTLTGTPVGNRWALAIGWCVVIGLSGNLWARQLYNREPSRRTGPSVAQLMGH